MDLESNKDFWNGYIEWTSKRIKKMHFLLNRKPATVLDLGCGHGWLGKSFEDMGCTVTYADVKDQRAFESKAEFIIVDVDAARWAGLADRSFDVVLNLGLIYHTINPYLVAKRSLGLCHGDLFLETEVSIGSDISVGAIEEFSQGEYIDRAYSKLAIRPNQHLLESQLDIYKTLCTWKRYDDSDLNHDIHYYTWKDFEYPENTIKDGWRRFYHIKKINS